MTATFEYNYTVETSWIDHNDHMHDAKYYSIFSDCVVYFFNAVGYEFEREDLPVTVFNLESHISFLKELRLGDSFYVRPYIYDFDAKRTHLILVMFNEQDEKIATYEVMMISVSNETRKSAPFPDKVYQTIADYYSQQPQFEIPKQVGHVIGIPKK